jgi:cell division protein FtsB
MAEFQKKSVKTSLWHSPLVLFVFFCVVLIFMYNMVGLIEKVRDTRKKTEIVHNQINDLNSREEALAGDIAKLKTDEGVEAVLRDKYQLVKSGEKMVVIVDQQASAKEAVPEKPKGNGFTEFFRNLFKRN